MISCPDLVRGQPRECIQMRCLTCITQAAALFPCQSALSWSSRRRRLFLLSRGGPRSEGNGVRARTRVARLVFSPWKENRPHLSPTPSPIRSPPPPHPQDGEAIFWSLLRQRWNRPACLKCTQMQFDLPSRAWEAQLGTAAPFFTPFTQNSAWKEEKKIELVLFLYGFVPLWFQVVVCFVALIFLTLPAAFPLVVYEIMMCYCFFFLFFLKKV